MSTVVSETTDTIGFIVNAVLFLCPSCSAEEYRRYGSSITLTRVYRINIGSYRQTCHECAVEVVSGKSDGWPELWPAELPLPIVERRGATC